jgi:hypothetical protein
MSTKWVVTAAAEQITLNQRREGETTFTITNPNGAADRVVFDVVAGEGADPGWFTVDEPQRLVRGGASVSYLMKVAVPAAAPPGSYEVQGRVYSVDSAPEESSVLSPRVKLEVPAEPEPVRRKLPWWWPIAAGAVALLLLIVVGILVFGGGDDPEPAPTPGAGELVMPDLIGMSEREALQALSATGLTVRPIRYRHDPDADDQVVSQSFEAGSTVDLDSIVDIEVAVQLAAPDVTAPSGVTVVARGDAPPTLQWDPGESPARRWRVSLFEEECYYLNTGNAFLPTCAFPETASSSEVVDVASYIPVLQLPEPLVPLGGTAMTGWIRWHVEPLDDFGNAGPASEFAIFRMNIY